MQKVVPKYARLIPEGATRVFKGVIFDIYQWQQRMFDGSEATFEMYKRPDTVKIICVVDDQVIVLDEEQPHHGSSMSLPGGRVDETDASTLEAAQREVLEEIGYTFDNWRLVDVAQPQAKGEWFVHCYLAWGGKQTADPHLDVGEKIMVQHKSFADFKKLVRGRHGHLGGVSDLVGPLTNLDDLLHLPEYDGTGVDR